MTGHDHDPLHHPHDHSETEPCPADLEADLPEAEFIQKHPQYLSQQSRRAFLGAAGVAGAAGLNFATNFLRGDREAAQAEIGVAESRYEWFAEVLEGSLRISQNHIPIQQRPTKISTKPCGNLPTKC